MNKVGEMALLLLAASLAGCATHRDPTYEGHYAWGAEANSFRPCGSSDVYWVNAADAARFRLTSEVASLTTKPNEPVFVEFAGSIGPVPSLDVGVAGAYDGMITLSWIGVIRRSSPLDCR